MDFMMRGEKAKTFYPQNKPNYIIAENNRRVKIKIAE